MTSDKGSKWVVSAQSSPAFVEVGDAAKIAIPHIVLASKDENKNDIKGYEERLEHVPHVVKTYDRSHGFQSARYVQHPIFLYSPNILPSKCGNIIISSRIINEMNKSGVLTLCVCVCLILTFTQCRSR